MGTDRYAAAGSPGRTTSRSRAGGPRRLVVVLVALTTAVSGCSVDQATGPGAPEATAPSAQASTGGLPEGFDAATAGDEDFDAVFSHEVADVDGVGLHYVVGGQGPPLVLLHGWPQTWFAWRGVMPALAAEHTVYAVDLPGLGDSTGTPSGYDKATLARYLHGLLADDLDLGPVDLVGHDLGAGVGFQYASQFPDDVDRYVHMDYPLPGPALTAADYRTFSWHLAFHSQPGLAEDLIDPDEVRDYLAYFYPQVAYGGVAFGGTSTSSPFTDAEVDEYARTYARPEVLAGGFELYRSLDADERDNTTADPVSAPTMLMTAEGGAEQVAATLQGRVLDLSRTVEVPRAGHWLLEENPEVVTTELLDFLTP